MIPPRGFRRAIPGTTAAGDDHPTDPRWRWLNAILLTLGPLILFGPMLIRGEALYWGTPILQFVPWRMLAFKIISLGYLPLWNPYLGMGAPLLANLQSALLYPPNAILALTGPAWGHGLLVLLHLIWAAWGMALLAKRLGLGGLAQLIAGLSFGLSGYMVSRAGFLTINAAASWLPWLILAAERLLQDSPRTGSWTSIIPSSARLSCALALQWLAGHAQTSWYTLTLVLVWLVWRSSEGRATHSPARAIAGLCVALAIAFMLSAVQLLPTLEYLTISQRAGALGRDFALTYSFWPWRILGLLVPNLFGSPATGDYWGYANYWEDAVYIGVLPIVLAGLGIIRGLRRGDGYGRLARLLAITGAVALLLALGKNTPIFPFLFDHIPTFNLFQAPTRWTLLLVFSLALLASLGVDSWTRPTGRVLYWTRLGTVGAGVILMAAPLGLIVLNAVEPTFVRAMATAGALLCLTGILTLRHPIRGSPRWILIVGGFVLFDLLLVGAGLNPSLPASVFTMRGETELTQVGDRGYLTEDADYMLKFEEAFPFSSFRSRVPVAALLELGLPNTSILVGRSSANNFDPLLPERYASFVERLEALEPDRRQAILALMNVSSQGILDEDGRFHLVPVEHPARVRVVGQVKWAGTAEASLDQVVAAGFHPDEVVILEGQPAASTTSSAGGEAWIEPNSDPGRVVVHVSAEGEAWLVLSDVWYPGWRALVDGTEVEVLKGDYLFRAVQVPGGSHIVTFVYSPWSFPLGLVLSLVAWPCVLIALWFRRHT